MTNRTGMQSSQEASGADGGLPRPGSGLFAGLGRIVTRYPWMVIAVWIVAALPRETACRGRPQAGGGDLGRTGRRGDRLGGQRGDRRVPRPAAVLAEHLPVALGPTLAIAVAVTLLAALTLIPAVVTLLGTHVFWPSKAWQREPKGARFAAIGSSLGKRPAVFAGVAGLVLLSRRPL